MEGGVLGLGSDAYEELKNEERGKPAWIIKTTKKPPSVTIGRGGEYIHTLSGEELRDIMRGYFQKEYYYAVIVDEETGHEIHVMRMIDLSKYTWLPRYMYRRFLKATCEVLGIVYRLEMLDAVTSKRLTPKAYVVFPPKSVFEKVEKRTAEIKEREESIKREIDNLREFMKGQKEEKK